MLLMIQQLKADGFVAFPLEGKDQEATGGQKRKADKADGADNEPVKKKASLSLATVPKSVIAKTSGYV